MPQPIYSWSTLMLDKHPQIFRPLDLNKQWFTYNRIYPNHFLPIHSGKGKFRCCCCVIAVISLMRCQKTWSNKLYGLWRLNFSWRWHCLDYNVLYLKCRVSLTSWQVLHFCIRKKHQKNDYTAKKGGSSKGFAEVFGFWVDSWASLTVQITFF